MREENEGRELMNKHEWLAEQFEAERPHLQAVAYRMLGSLSEADDAVQESWLHLSRSDRSTVKNLGGWLTTVVARICLDMLRTPPGAGRGEQEKLYRNIAYEAGIFKSHGKLSLFCSPVTDPLIRLGKSWF